MRACGALSGSEGAMVQRHIKRVCEKLLRICPGDDPVRSLCRRPSPDRHVQTRGAVHGCPFASQPASLPAFSLKPACIPRLPVLAARYRFAGRAHETKHDMLATAIDDRGTHLLPEVATTYMMLPPAIDDRATHLLRSTGGQRRACECERCDARGALPV